MKMVIIIIATLVSAVITVLAINVEKNSHVPQHKEEFENFRIFKGNRAVVEVFTYSGHEYLLSSTSSTNGGTDILHSESCISSKHK